MLRQSPSFWLASIYLLFEYVRPQSVYDSLEGPPYAQISIILGLVFVGLERGRIRFGGTEVLLGIFTFIVLASSVTAVSPSVAYGEL
ncbi:MAG: hypothetical protein ABIS03_01955, partial [Gemmatimonadaceae bacterium]